MPPEKICETPPNGLTREECRYEVYLARHSLTNHAVYDLEAIDP
jgi:hypothetical protein